jgi:hypothetical protein
MSRQPERLCQRRIASALLPVLMLLLGATLVPAPAQAAAPLTWSSPTSFDAGRTSSALSCASESLCVAVDHSGYASSTSDPTAATTSWSAAAIDPGQSLNAVSCAPGGPCVAVDDRGDALVSTGASASSWSSSSTPDGGTALTGVSCPSAALCVAVSEEGEILTSTNPAAGGWALASSHPGHRLTGVSCASQTLCVAVDSAGDVLASSNPTSAGGWSTRTVDSAELLAVSCWASGACVAVDSAGDALASADPTASAATWSLTPVDDAPPTAVSCASSGLCVVADQRGEALAIDDATSPIPVWSPSEADHGESIAGVSCLAGGFCMAVDAAGRSVSARVPAPAVTTLTPTEVTDASAILAGAVDPEDAALSGCSFEYGPGGAGSPFIQSIPCSAIPTATAGSQDVSAQLSGLSPNTVYHYRVLASSPAGSSFGAEETFTTAVSSQIAIVHPNPSITGTPANGQKLTCHPGTPAGTSAQLSYAWLRDQIPIAGATGSSYMVKGQDTGHHLQCQVTATDGGGSATAKSAFVTIPVGGVPVSAGETAVGKASFKDGRVSVPIVCSTQTIGGCAVALRLSAVETLSGARVVAIAARANKPSAHKSAAGLRHVSVKLAGARVRLAQGAHATVSAALDASGRRLLGAIRHFTGYVYVTGTVIGVIEARLAQQLITLSASSHAASTHAARR